MKNINIEIVKDFDNSYYANVSVDGALVRTLPENVNYRTLKLAIKDQVGFEMPALKTLSFARLGRKRYAQLQNH